MNNDNIDIPFFKELTISKYNEVTNKGISGFTVKCFFKREYPEFYNFILDSYPGDFGQKLFLFVHDLTEPPKCQFCHEHSVRWYGFIRGFGKWCSMTCMNKDIEHFTAMHDTMMERYGSAYALQVKEFNEKLRETIGNKDSQPERFAQSLEKRIQTSQERYGVDNVMFSEEFISRQKEAIKEKYGVEYAMQNEDVKKQFLEKLQAKVEANPDYWKDRQIKIETTYFKKYGTTHPQRDIALGHDKRKETCRQRYGVDWYLQSHECHQNRRKQVSCGQLTFDSAWEVSVYQFCQEHNIPCEYQPDVLFEYECDGEFHAYQPDFRINGVLYEVKGDHFFRINETTGEEEMFLPFRGHSMADEEYRHACSVYNAKYKCMKEHGVRLLKGYEISHLDEVLLT